MFALVTELYLVASEDIFCRRRRYEGLLDDVPGIFCSVAKLGACHTSGQTEVADGDLLVHKLVGEIVGSFRHGANEHADALIWLQGFHILPDLHNRRIETECDLPAVRRQVIRDRVLDNLQQLLLGVCRANRQAMQ